VLNLSLLGYFKYAGFVATNLNELLAGGGVPLELAVPHNTLPVGISFYTFMSLSYTIDVYRRRERARSNPIDFALFLTFFPHLVAGPIVRAADFLPQCEQPRSATSSEFGWGLTLLLAGVFQKVVLADSFLAPVVDHVYGTPGSAGFVDAWIGTLAFSGQIFFDFAGYSTSAIGAALCLGFVLRDNFRFPYAAVGFSDFWRRWHISLSSWLRDYLYIPLGGNRLGERRTYVNLFLTMVLGGLWHGAAWNFVIWGVLHGSFLIGERLIRGPDGGGQSARPSIVGAAATYLLVCVAWVFFRATTTGGAANLLAGMAGARGLGASVGTPTIALVLTIIGALLVFQWKARARDLAQVVAGIPWWLRAVIIAGMIFGLFAASGDDRAFIYFQF
jgi:alginate O-acetyltransferase complex protein AlgI